MKKMVLSVSWTRVIVWVRGTELWVLFHSQVDIYTPFLNEVVNFQSRDSKNFGCASMVYSDSSQGILLFLCNICVDTLERSYFTILESYMIKTLIIISSKRWLNLL